MGEVSQIQNCWELLELTLSEIKALNTLNTAALYCPKDAQSPLRQPVNQGFAVQNNLTAPLVHSAWFISNINLLLM